MLPGQGGAVVELLRVLANYEFVDSMISSVCAGCVPRCGHHQFELAGVILCHISSERARSYMRSLDVLTTYHWYRSYA